MLQRRPRQAARGRRHRLAARIMSARKRILFFGEPATLAHVMRAWPYWQEPIAAELYDFVVATGPDYRSFVERKGLRSP